MLEAHVLEHVTGDVKNSRKHALNEHGSFSCDKCEYIALDKSILKQHMKQQPGTLLFTCRICELEASKQDMLENHIESKHRQYVDDTKSL